MTSSVEASAGTDELRYATIHELAAMLRARSLSAVELTQWTLEILNQEGSRLNAVAAVLPERALVQASRADRRLRRSVEGAGPLVGIPFGAKDLIAAAGAPTTFGSSAYRDNVVASDAPVVSHLEKEGAVLVAKLAMAELAGFGTSDPRRSYQGPGRNPWDRDRWAGGSSTGSGAAVSAGLMAASLGSETAGSIGAPSAWCGVTGLRPTYGLVDMRGVMPLAPTLDKVGPITHSALDCGLLIEATATRGNRRRLWRRGELGNEIARLQHAMRELRVGIAEQDFEVAAPPATRPAYRAALAALGDLNMSMRECSVPIDLPYRQTLNTIMEFESARSFTSLIIGPRFAEVGDGNMRAAIRKATRISPERYSQAMADRQRVIAAGDELFKQVDLIVAYNFAYPWPVPTLDRPFEQVPILGGNTAMVWVGNLAGLPGLFLPVGLGSDGLPVGIQLVGPRDSEPVLLAVGIAFQAATSWHRLRPPVWP